MKFKLVSLFICIFLIAATLTATGAMITLKNSALPIFPGAEGFGTKTRGAYGGSTNPVIYKVTNLNAGGSGSLRAGLEDTVGPRIIIFEVSGTIELNGYIWVDNPYVTVAGQTAPSPGITLKGGGICVRTHDVIVQHIRIRAGDRSGVDFYWRDCLDIGEQGRVAYNVVIDHCSFSWATDENTATWYPTHDVTYQWCIISEGLDDSYHPEGPHSMGMLIGPESYRTSIHHNLFAHNANRNPLVGGYGETEIINNVVYNWEWGSTEFQHYSSAGPQYGNIIGNFYKAGKNTLGKNQAIMVYYATSPSKFYIHNNIGPERTSNNQDDWDIVSSSSNRDTLRSNSPTFASSVISTQNAFDAYNAVLNNAGARPGDRDSVDKRVVEDVKDGSGQHIDSQDEVGGWPNLLTKNYRALTIPSNPHEDNDGDGYTNLEEWLQAYAAEIEKISSDNYPTEIVEQPSVDYTPEVEEQPSEDSTPEIVEQPSSDSTPEVEEQPSSDSTPEIVEQPSVDSSTKNEKHLSDKISKIKPSTNSGFTTVNLGYLDFIEKSYEKLWIFVALVKFQLQKTE